MRTPTQGELADFRGFCRNASASQLREIYAKERRAGRLAYAAAAREVAAERNIDLED